MATLTTGNRQRAVKKVTVKIKDTIFNVAFEKQFFTWTTLHELKLYLKSKNGVKPAKQRLFQHQSEIRSNNVTVEDLLEDEDRDDHLTLTLRYKTNDQANEPYVKPLNDKLLKLDWVRVIVNTINKGFNVGLAPQAITFGVSGTYILRDHCRNNWAIFKPLDEEPYAPNNQKGYIGKLGSKAMREGILSGEGASREVAAFLLDSKRIHRVPETFFAELYHPSFEDSSVHSESAKADIERMVKADHTEFRNGVKYGSIQFMKKNDGESCDFSCRKFSVADVQSIAALDIRILNCDRNEGNILVRQLDKDSFTLIPIDHALSLSDSLAICDYELCWSLWPHVEEPTNPALRDYICSLDTRDNVRKLRKHLRIRPICLRNYRIAETLLIKATRRGLTLFDISKIMYKLTPEGPNSVLEDIVAKSEEIYSIVRCSVSKSMYLQLNDIHQKVANDPAIERRTPTKSKAETCEMVSTSRKSAEPSPKLRPAHRSDKAPLFHDSSKICIEPKFAKHSSASDKRKRAQSVFEADDMPPDGCMRLAPIALDFRPPADGEEKDQKTDDCQMEQIMASKGREGKQQKSLTPSNVEKTLHRTATKQAEKLEDSSPSTMRRTISTPDLNSKHLSPKAAIGFEPRRSEAVEYDEMFFYYFENILEQVLLKFASAKQGKNRDRAQSYFA